MSILFLVANVPWTAPGHGSHVARQHTRRLPDRNGLQSFQVRRCTARATQQQDFDNAGSDFPRTGVPPFAASAKPVPQASVEQWLQDVEDRDATVRLRAILACKDLSSERAAPILVKVFDQDEREIQNRSFAALFLGYKPNPRSFEILVGLVESEKEADEVRANAVAAFGYLRDPRAIPLCLSLLRDTDTHWSTRSSSADALGMIAETNRQIAPLIYDDLVSTLRSVKPTDIALIPACIGALGEVGDPRGVLDVADYLDAEDFTVGQCACEALGKLPSEETEKILTRFVERKDGHVNVLWAAEIALKSVRECLRG